MTIKLIHARQILDSRDNPTVEVSLKTAKHTVTASVPSGASTGIHEALELRDKTKAFHGKGVTKAIKNINTILNKKLKGMDCKKQQDIDNLMLKIDGTKNKSKLGANAILPVSMAVCKAAALENNIPLFEYISKISGRKNIRLPVPFCNIVNGGRHADNKLQFQEFMIVPVKFTSFKKALRAASEIYQTLKKDIHKRYGRGTTIGDEGGFAPEEFDLVREPLNFIKKAIAEAGYKNKVKIAIDAAASEFYKRGKYSVDNKQFTKEKLLQYYKDLIKKQPIISLEDPFREDDFNSFAKLTKSVKIQIVGDDLLVTNPARVKKAIKAKACNCLLLKINQIGTITEAIKAANLAFDAGWNVMVSHRSGETNDDFIADLSVGLGTGQIKAGAPCRGERLAKYNQLLRIEESLGKKAKFPTNLNNIKHN